MNGDIRYGFHLGDWQVYPLRNLLVGPRGKIHIEPKVMQVLEKLAGRPGHVVERENLLTDVWPGRAVSDEPLTRCIAALRHVLDDDPMDPKYIQTIPKRGYRIVCRVESMEQAPNDLSDDSNVQKYRRIALLALAVLITSAVLFLAYRLTPDTPVAPPLLTVDAATQPAPSVFSIAVLPFRNRSPAAEDAIFVDGIHDDILTQLTKLSSLEKVISRTSVERYRETDLPLPQIGSELAVANVLEGSVQRSGDRVRIIVRLVDVATDNLLWAEEFERRISVENLFAIQNEISRKVVTALHVVLTDEENGRLRTMPTTSLAAYGEYILGRQVIADRTYRSIEKARTHFEKAVQLNSDYELAQIGLADSIALQLSYPGTPIDDTFEIRRAAINKALSLNPNSGEAYTSLAYLKYHEGEYAASENFFRKAIELNPNYALAYAWYSVLLGTQGRHDEALENIGTAIDLDPMTPFYTHMRATVLWNLERIEEMEAALLRGIKRNPEFHLFYVNMADRLRTLGRIGEALKWQETAVSLVPSESYEKYQQCHLYLELGNDQAAEQCYESAEQMRPEHNFGLKMNLYIYRSEHQQAVDYLESLVQRNFNPITNDLLATAYLVNSEPQKAARIWKDQVPALYSDEKVVIDRSQIHKAVQVAYTLYIDGRLDRANYLFDQALETMRGLKHTDHTSFRYLDAFIYTVRGDKQKAIDALRNAIDSGCRENWWDLRMPMFESMREEPEWNKLVANLENDIARQRLWYENHRDDPLF